MSEAFKMPVPFTIVRWAPGPTDKSVPAIVTEVSKYSVALAVIPPDSARLFPKNSVRHRDDPWIKINGLNADSGVWWNTKETLYLEEAIDTVNKMEDEVNNLEKRVDTLHEIVLDSKAAV